MPLPDHWEASFSQNNLHHVYMHCPHCDTPSTFAVTVAATENVGHNAIYYVVLQCNAPRCRKRTYVVTTKNVSQGAQNRQLDSLTVYPSGPEPTAHESIPPPVANDWIEAQKTFNVGATKAAATMCRRVLYGVML